MFDGWVIKMCSSHSVAPHHHPDGINTNAVTCIGHGRANGIQRFPRNNWEPGHHHDLSISLPNRLGWIGGEDDLGLGRHRAPTLTHIICQSFRIGVRDIWEILIHDFQATKWYLMFRTLSKKSTPLSKFLRTWILMPQNCCTVPFPHEGGCIDRLGRMLFGPCAGAQTRAASRPGCTSAVSHCLECEP